MITTINKEPRSARLNSRLLFIGVGFVIIFVAACAYATLAYLHQEAQLRVASNTQNLAQSVEQTLEGTIDTIDIALLSVADEIQRQQKTGKTNQQEIEEMLRRQKMRMAHVAFLHITDRNGNVVYGLDDKGSQASMADREFFTSLQSKSGVGLFVTKPLFGKIAKRWLWTFARRIEDADGNFGGTVYASIYTEELEQFLRQIHMESGGSIAIRDTDLDLIARTTFERSNPIATGNKVISLPFSEALNRNQNQGTYISDASSVDPVNRIYSFHRSAKYKFLTNVGSSLDTAFSAWRNQLIIVSILLTLFALMILILSRKISLAWIRYDHVIAQLKENAAELKLKHLTLAKAEHQHREILEKLYTAIVVHAADTSIVFSNTRASEILGLSEDQLKGRVAIDPDWCFIDEYGTRLLPDEYPVSRVIKTGAALTEMVLGIRNPNYKGIRWVLVSAFLENDERSQLKQIIVNFHDITERKEAELRWQFALEGAGDGVWDVNLESDEAVYSKRYLEMLGYTEGDFSTHYDAWSKHVHPDDIGQLQEMLKNYLLGQVPVYAIEYRLRCKDGSYKWIYARGMVVNRDRDGNPLRMVGTHTDISEMKLAEAKIWTEANYDSLTQLPNRRLFYDRIEESIKKAQRDNARIALLFIDLDHFKEVNDTLGHHVGDRLLIEAAARIKASVRAYDTVARLGGDEFTVILSNIHDTVDIGHIAQKIIDHVSLPYFLAGVESYVSASIGISLYPDDASTVVNLTKNADQAMYSAKDAGRQCFKFFTKTMQEDATHRMRLTNDLRHALKDQQFEVHYQAIINLKDGKTCKAEALLRWRHPELGFISPAIFIPVAEDTGTIHEIGDWVFSQALAQVQICEQQTGKKFQISVNKSPVQFLVERVEQQAWIDTLAASKIAGDRIVVEITEGVLINDDIRVSKSLLQYRDAGIQVAIDDFGTGYSSLSYLKKFDVDYIKIDQSFTQNLSPTSPDYALCEAIVVMAHKLGIQVIAEGVETEEQRDILCEIGCDYGQGYLFSRPLPAEKFMEFLLKS
jgi:diguanylate cyclase (GGDEF)-like protein/PAS domain S-box-containing protein